MNIMEEPMEEPEEKKPQETPPVAPEAAAPAPPVPKPSAVAAIAGLAALAAPPPKPPDPVVYLKAMLDDAKHEMELAEGRLAKVRAERDEWRLRYERTGAEVNCLRPRVEALERERRESLTESRLNERDALRSEAAGLARKIAALEKALAEACAEGEKWKVHIKGISHEIERARATAEAMQRARDLAYHDRDLAQAAQREAEERAARLEGELKKEREARAEEKRLAAEAAKAGRAGRPAVKEGAKA